MSTVTIVIVNYNGLKFQNDCLKSLYNMNYKDFDIVIVDSASTDGSVELAERDYPNVHIIKCTENVGVAKGNNIGIRYSIEHKSKYTLLSNNDIIVDSCVLTELLKSADDKMVTVPKIYYYTPNDLLWYAGGEMNWKNPSGIHIGSGEKDKEEYNVCRDCTYSPTCFMLIPNSVFEKIGLIDEKYFMYYDDNDFCARLINAEYKIRYVPSAFLWHKISSSSGGARSKIGIYYSIRNQLYFTKKFKRYVKPFANLRIHMKNLARLLILSIKYPNYKYIIKAYKDYFLGKMGRADDL